MELSEKKRTFAKIEGGNGDFYHEKMQVDGTYKRMFSMVAWADTQKS